MSIALSVVIPAHNEAGAIAALVTETFAVLPPALVAEVIVVDDASTDGTATALREAMARGWPVLVSALAPGEAAPGRRPKG